MATRQWHYVQSGRQAGPVAEDVLRRMVDTGAVGPSDLIWTDGFADWQPAGQVPEFAGRTAATAPPVFETENDSPYAAPMVTVTRAYGPSAGRVSYAGFWKRFVALIIDGIVVQVAAFMGGALIGLTLGAVSRDVAEAVAGVFGFLLQWLYFAIMECSDAQATLGKMALGIKVTNMNGQRIHFGRASGRYFGKIVSGLILGFGFLMAGFTDKKQALHDMLAGTLVVNKR
jgi:uncharacterized RDD family membrane protein YckC